jgi:glycosyltransferase involved in cell wall biosynthesis
MVAHPSPDLYGSDLQMLRVVEGLAVDGWTTTVLVPRAGALLPKLRAIPRVEVRVARFPVLRKAILRPVRMLVLLLGVPVDIGRAVLAIRQIRPDVVYVNTMTIPGWIIAARLCRRAAVVHVREAEESASRIMRWMLALPLVGASVVVANSHASRNALLEVVPALRERVRVVYNGVLGPEQQTLARPIEQTHRLVLVGRLSPRKGIDVALEAVARLRSQGRQVHLDVCGSAYEGYESYEEQLHDRAALPDLAGAVRFLGYVHPTWPSLAAADVVLVPSRTEPFGNTAVEGLLAGRPVVASAVQGLGEIIESGRTGLLVAPGDPQALAEAIAKFLDDPTWAEMISHAGQVEARERFAVDRYQSDIRGLLRSQARRRTV